MQNDISLDCESVDTQGLIRRNPRKVYRFFHPQVQKKKMDALRKIRDGRELKKSNDGKNILGLWTESDDTDMKLNIHHQTVFNYFSRAG